MLSMEFLITSLVVVVVPGTGVIYTVSTGLFKGWQASIAAAAGCTAGILPHLLASVLGLSAIMHMSALAFQAVKYAGAAYLLYLAWSMWRDTGMLEFGDIGSRKGLWQIAAKGVLINILNPKLSIFFLAFLPLFVAPGAASPLVQMLLMSAVFMGMTLVIFILYGICANSVRGYIAQSPKWIVRLQRSFALVFAVLSIKLAMAEQ
jgi:threonine/homoserine/homoserine lactone efflux protein